jgi:hypothetical protein
MGVVHPAVSQPFEPVEQAIADLVAKEMYYNQTDEAGIGTMPAQVQTEILNIRTMLQGLAGNKDQPRVLTHLKSINDLETRLKANKVRYDEEVRSLRAELQRLMGEWAVCPTKTDASNVQEQYRQLSASTDLVSLKGGVEVLRTHVHFCSSPEARRKQLVDLLGKTITDLELPPECSAFEHSKYGYFGETVTTEKNKLVKLQQGVRDGTVTNLNQIQPTITSAQTTHAAILKYCREYNERGWRATVWNALPSKYAVATGLGAGALAAAAITYAPAIATSAAIGTATNFATNVAYRTVDNVLAAKTKFGEGYDYLKTGELPPQYRTAEGSYAVPPSGIIPGGSYGAPNVGDNDTFHGVPI